MNLNSFCHIPVESGKKWRPLIKFLITMKLIMILSVIFMQQVYAEVNAQTISLSCENVSMKSIFKEINRQTGHEFLYNSKMLEKAQPVSVKLEKATISEALEKCFKGQPITYVIEGNTIVVTPRTVNQNIVIKGKVTNSKGEPLPGTNIIIKGTIKGTFTDENGSYQIEAPENATLIFAFIGYIKSEVAVSGRGQINVTMKEEESLLNEAQVIAYGVVKSRLNTGSVSTVKGADLARQPVTDVMKALQGMIPGLTVDNIEGGMAQASKINIRGLSSIKAGTTPMIILDGAVIANTPFTYGSYTTGGSAYQSRAQFPNADQSADGSAGVGISPFFGINLNDIESVTVLKDADATSIYGSRGTNGVIIIKTKDARPGPAGVTIDARYGLTVPKLPELMNTTQYLKMRHDAFAAGNYNYTTGVTTPVAKTVANAPDLLLWDTTAYTNWAKYVYQNYAPQYNVQASFNGGEKNVSYLASLNFNKTFNFTMNDPYTQQLNGSLKVNYCSNDSKFRGSIGVSYNPSHTHSGSGVNGGNVINLAPNFPLVDNYGQPYQYPSDRKLVSPLVKDGIVTDTWGNQFTANLNLSYLLAKGLEIKLQASHNNQQSNLKKLQYSTTVHPLDVNSSTVSKNGHTMSKSTIKTFNVEPQLTYNKKIGKGILDLLAGGTFLQTESNAYSAHYNFFPSDALLNIIALAGNVEYRNNTESTSRFISAFGRATFNWNDKYIVNATFRRDGSNKFGPGNRFGNFGAVGVAWIFSDEKFIKDNLPFLSYGKFRGSYGTTGNDNITGFLHQLYYSPTNLGWYQYNSVVSPTSIPNPDIKWEMSRKIDAGLELGFFKDRILLTVDWYRNRTSDLIMNGYAPIALGIFNYTSNMPGIVENSGWEFKLNTFNFGTKSPVSWKTSIVLSTVKNKLASISDVALARLGSSYKVGSPLPNGGGPSMGTYSSGSGYLEYGYIFDHINPENGLPMYKASFEDTVCTYTPTFAYLGSTLPKFQGGITNSFSYKGFQLDLYCSFMQKKTTNWRAGTFPGYSFTNPISEFEGKYWTTPGQIAEYPRLETFTSWSPVSRYAQSTAIPSDVFFIRLNNISLGYNFSQSITNSIKLKKIYIYFSAQNPALLYVSDKKLGKDPELGSVYSTPVTTTFTFGIRAGF